MDSPSESLPALLAARARAASDGALAMAVLVGVAISIAAAVWHHKAWLLPCGLGVTVAMFGTWGIADRELALHEHEEPGFTARSALALRAAASLVGALALAVVAFALMSRALGTWIS